jgi:arylsulfatase A-like enzyme
MDIFPTVADILGLPRSVFVEPVDGESLRPLLTRELGPRRQPIPFLHRGRSALVDNRYKLVGTTADLTEFELYDLEDDPGETRNIAADQPVIAEQLRQHLRVWNRTVEASVAGRDYPEGRVTPADPEPVAWTGTPQYQPFLAEWSQRWEYADVIKRDAPDAAR